MKSILRIASAQFEHSNGDKNRNLAEIDRIAGCAAASGADVVAFHECSVTGYSFVRRFSREKLLELSEMIPEGQSCQKLQRIALKYNIIVLAGLFEKDVEGSIYKAYVCVDSNGLVAKYRKLHPFIHPSITPGNEYVTFDIKGWKCTILICYDNNIVENVRACGLLGSEVIFMPHVTMCTPATRPGAGFVDPELWRNKDLDPISLRAEFDGLKGRAWLMKWLPSRAYDNAAYVVFSNAIGMDDDQLKNGCSMIIDPHGDILSECRELGAGYALAACCPEKSRLAGGARYRHARRPELYKDIIGQNHLSEQHVSWLKYGEKPGGGE